MRVKYERERMRNIHLTHHEQKTRKSMTNKSKVEKEKRPRDGVEAQAILLCYFYILVLN